MHVPAATEHLRSSPRDRQGAALPASHAGRVRGSSRERPGTRLRPVLLPAAKRISNRGARLTVNGVAAAAPRLFS